MPRPVLTGPTVGFFGKLPSSGDFITRGLPAGLRPFIDHWLTKGLAAHCKTPGIWPKTGLRAILNWNGRAVVMLIFPSADKTGRVFPFALCRVAVGGGTDRSAADIWCHSVLALAEDAVSGKMVADNIIRMLNGNFEDDLAQVPGTPDDIIWHTESDSVPIPGDGLAQAVDKVFATVSSY